MLLMPRVSVRNRKGFSKNFSDKKRFDPVTTLLTVEFVSPRGAARGDPCAHEDFLHRGGGLGKLFIHEKGIYPKIFGSEIGIYPESVLTRKRKFTLERVSLLNGVLS